MPRRYLIGTSTTLADEDIDHKKARKRRSRSWDETHKVDESSGRGPVPSAFKTDHGAGFAERRENRGDAFDTRPTRPSPGRGQNTAADRRDEWTTSSPARARSSGSRSHHKSPPLSSPSRSPISHHDRERDGDEPRTRRDDANLRADRRRSPPVESVDNGVATGDEAGASFSRDHRGKHGNQWEEQNARARNNISNQPRRRRYERGESNGDDGRESVRSGE